MRTYPKKNRAGKSPLWPAKIPSSCALTWVQCVPNRALTNPNNIIPSEHPVKPFHFELLLSNQSKLLRMKPFSPKPYPGLPLPRPLRTPLQDTEGGKWSVLLLLGPVEELAGVRNAAEAYQLRVPSILKT